MSMGSSPRNRKYSSAEGTPAAILDLQHQNIYFDCIERKAKGKPSAAIEVKSKSLFGPFAPSLNSNPYKNFSKPV